MANKGKQTKPMPANLRIIPPHAAGIDGGAEEHGVGVPADRDAQPVQKLSAFPCDLHRLADWLTACRMTTVVMESTGGYWIPRFQILEARGFEVALVNARHVKNVPGRPKTDRCDCRWLQKLHTSGFLAPSFRPPEDICRLRSRLRHRENLIRMTVKHSQHMQKSLDQLNLHLHHVISDIPRVTGLRIIRAIVAGERDPRTFATYRDYRIKSRADTIAKALEGDYRLDHVFPLTQSLALHDFTQQQIAACDQAIERVLGTFDSLVDPDEHPVPPPTTAHRQPQRNEPAFDLRPHLYRITGVDLTQVPGLQAPTSHIILAEVGLNMHTWPTDKHFASWLGLCPDNQISGGKVLSTGSRRVQNRASRALRMAAQRLRTSPSYLGAFYRRMRSKLGPATATTATAHKLAKIIYHMLKEKTPYRARGAEEYLHKDQERKIRQLRTQAQHLGFDLVPQTSNGYTRKQQNDDQHKNISPFIYDETETSVHHILDVLLNLSRAQAVRPMRHWWLCPRVLAWFRVLVIVSRVKRPAAAGQLSRIGDYLLLQHEGLDSGDDLTDAAQYERHRRRMGTASPRSGTLTRSPPPPLFHRRRHQRIRFRKILHLS